MLFSNSDHIPAFFRSLVSRLPDFCVELSPSVRQWKQHQKSIMASANGRGAAMGMGCVPGRSFF
jgi:hypothetical protein